MFHPYQRKIKSAINLKVLNNEQMLLEIWRENNL